MQHRVGGSVRYLWCILIHVKISASPSLQGVAGGPTTIFTSLVVGIHHGRHAHITQAIATRLHGTSSVCTPTVKLDCDPNPRDKHRRPTAKSLPGITKTFAAPLFPPSVGQNGLYHYFETEPQGVILAERKRDIALMQQANAPRECRGLLAHCVAVWRYTNALY